MGPGREEGAPPGETLVARKPSARHVGAAAREALEPASLGVPRSPAPPPRLHPLGFASPLPSGALGPGICASGSPCAEARRGAGREGPLPASRLLLGPLRTRTPPGCK